MKKLITFLLLALTVLVYGQDKNVRAIDVVENISVYFVDTAYYKSLTLDSLHVENVTEFVYVSNAVADTLVVPVIEFVERVTVDALHIHVPECRVEYVEVYVTEELLMQDTIVEIEFKDALISSNSGVQEILNKSFGNNILYDLQGNQIRRPMGVYIENGKIKYIKI